jgi:hypothetical protein
MTDLLEYIKKMQEMYGDDVITTADKLERPPKALEQQMFQDFDIRNPKADGGQIVGKPGGLVEEGVEYYATKIYKVTTGSHKGEWALPEATYDPATKTKSTKNKYFKTKTALNTYLKETKTPLKYSKTELNKAAKFFYEKGEVSSPKFDELDVKSREWNRVYDRVRAQKGKFSKITQADPLTEIQQNKILKEFPDAKFTPKNKFGFPPGHENYQKVTAFVTRGYKKPFQGTQLQALPKYAQKELIEAFPEVKFDFDRDTLLRKGSQFSKYGVPVSHPKYSKIAKYFAKSKVWKYNFDLRSPEGWMMSQMERSYAQNGDASPYRPITKNGGPIAKNNPMIGIEHNGKKYNMKTIVNHPDFDNTKKYWNIADKTSKKYLNKFENLAKLLPEGFDPKKIQLNDLLQFISDKDGVQGLNRAKRAIQIHHEYGVGPRATTNYQLLRQDMNLLANKTNNLLKSKDLSKVEKGAAQALERNTRLVVDDVRYGPKKVSATGDIKNIISQAESELKSFTKKDFKIFASQLEKLGCGKAAGGRILMSNGGATLTKCARKGSNKLEQIILRGGANKTEQDLAKKILQAGRGLRSMFSLSGMFGPAATAFLIGTEAGLVGYDMISQGKTFREAVGDSVFNYALGPKLKIDSIEERNKRLRGIGGGPPSQAFRAMSEKEMGKIAAYESALSDINRIENIFTKDQTTKQKLEEAKKFFPAVVDKRQKEADAVRADIQDLARTGTERRLMNVDYDAGAKALKKAQDLITIDQLTSSGPKIFGKILPRTEESRQDAIAKARGMDLALKNANPGVLFARENRYMYPFGFASGGLANLTNTIPPESGPMSQGLRSLYNNGKKL